MKVTFGDKSSFAIDAMLEPGLDSPSPVWGRMCIVVSNFEIGDFNEEHCGLYGAICHLNQTIEIIDELWDDQFIDLPDEEIGSMLYEAWFESGYDDNGNETPYNKLHKFRFDYGLPEMFDGDFMMFLLNPPNEQLKLLYITKSGNATSSFGFDKALFVSTINEFNRWYVQQSILLCSENA